MTLIDKAEAVTLLHEIADDFADPHVRGAAIAVAHIFTERADTLPARGVGVKKIRQIVEDESLEWAGLREGVLFQRVLDKIDAFLAALALKSEGQRIEDATTDAVRCAECDCDDGNCTWIKDAAHDQ